MRLIITWLKKDGTCRSFTNASPEAHTCMAITVWNDAMKRLGKKWEMSRRETYEKINNILRDIGDRSKEDE